jgi:hypothetical protein
MAFDLTTYSGLQDAIADFLNRTDLKTSGEIAGFITLAEATLRRKLRRQTSKSSFVFTTATNSKILPASVAELRAIAPAVSVDRPRGGKALTYLAWETFTEKRARLATTGTPQFFTLHDSVVYVAPAPDDDNLDFDILTYDALVSVSTDVSLLLAAPDLYLYGGLVHSAPFLEHDERMDLWATVFLKAIDELNEQRQKEEFSIALSAPRLPVNFGGGRII